MTVFALMSIIMQICYIRKTMGPPVKYTARWLLYFGPALGHGVLWSTLLNFDLLTADSWTRLEKHAVSPEFAFGLSCSLYKTVKCQMPPV